MRNSGLRQLDAKLNVTRTKTSFLSDRIRSFLFEGLQDASAGGVGNRVQEAVEARRGIGHWKSSAGKFADLSLLLFHDRIISISDEPLPHRFRVFQVTVRSDLNVKILIA